MTIRAFGSVNVVSGAALRTGQLPRFVLCRVIFCAFFACLRFFTFLRYAKPKNANKNAMPANMINAITLLAVSDSINPDEVTVTSEKNKHKPNTRKKADATK